MKIIWCMVSEIWSMTDRIFCHFGPCFAILLPPLTNQKIKILKKWIKALEISSFCIGVPKIMITCYNVPEIHAQWVYIIFIFYFGLFFTFLFPKPKKSKFLKKEKKAWRYHHFTHVYQKLWSHDVWFLRYGVQQTDRQTGTEADRWMEKVTYRSGCPT